MRLKAGVQNGLLTDGARAPFSRREKGRDEGFTPKSLSAVPSSGAPRHLLPMGEGEPQFPPLRRSRSWSATSAQRRLRPSFRSRRTPVRSVTTSCVGEGAAGIAFSFGSRFVMLGQGNGKDGRVIVIQGWSAIPSVARADGGAGAAWRKPPGSGRESSRGADLPCVCPAGKHEGRRSAGAGAAEP